MKLTGPACTEAMNEAEEAGRRERAEDSAGGVRVERRVEPNRNALICGVFGEDSFRNGHIGKICLENIKQHLSTRL